MRRDRRRAGHGERHADVTHATPTRLVSEHVLPDLRRSRRLVRAGRRRLPPDPAGLPAGRGRLAAGPRTDPRAGPGRRHRQAHRTKLVALGLDVVAVEPADGMRAELPARPDRARCWAGTAEHIPLPDADVDAVLVAQAWHWFDPAAASAEIARVLRPRRPARRRVEHPRRRRRLGGPADGDPAHAATLDTSYRYDRPELDDRLTEPSTRRSAGSTAWLPRDLRVLARAAATTLTLDPSTATRCSTPSTSSTPRTRTCAAATRSTSRTARSATAPTSGDDGPGPTDPTDPIHRTPRSVVRVEIGTRDCRSRHELPISAQGRCRGSDGEAQGRGARAGIDADEAGRAGDLGVLDSGRRGGRPGGRARCRAGPPRGPRAASTSSSSPTYAVRAGAVPEPAARLDEDARVGLAEAEGVDADEHRHAVEQADALELGGLVARRDALDSAPTARPAASRLAARSRRRRRARPRRPRTPRSNDRRSRRRTRRRPAPAPPNAACSSFARGHPLLDDSRPRRACTRA